MQKSNVYLHPTETLELAEALLSLLTGSAERGEPGDAERCYWAQQRAALALQSIVDCSAKQAAFYVEAALCRNAQWLEHLP